MTLPRPTTAGLGLLVASGSLLLLRPPGALADLLLLGLLGLGGVGFGLAWRTAREAPLVRRRVPPVATRGELVSVVHEVEHGGPRQLRDLWVRELGPGQRAATFFPGLAPAQRASAATRVWAGQRGRLRLPGVELRVGDPFGLFEVLLPRQVESEVLVRPRPRRAAGRWVLLARRGRGLDPAQGWTGVREWRPGDPSRDVHWRLSARRGFPVVVTRPPRTDESALLVLDRSTVPGPRGSVRFERAVALAAGVGLLLLEEGRPMRFLAPGEQGGLDLVLRGRAGGQQLLEALALLGPDPGGLGALPADAALEEAVVVSPARRLPPGRRAALLVDEEGRA